MTTIVEAIDILAKAAEVGFEKEARSIQFHDQVIQTWRQNQHSAKLAKASQKQDKKDPKALDHKSPLTSGKRVAPDESTKIQEKSAAAMGGGPTEASGGAEATAVGSSGLRTSVSTSPSRAPAASPTPSKMDAGSEGGLPKSMRLKMAGYGKKPKKAKKPMTKAYSLGYLLGKDFTKECL